MFSSRLRNEHKTLSEYRHPLVHYQQGASFIRGSYGAALARLSMQSAYDDPAGLEELLAKMDAILDFLNTELPKCHQAFINVVQLCEALAPAPAKKRDYTERILQALQKFARLFKSKVKS